MTNTAPWPDFYGEEIREGDIIDHPSGQSGVVVFCPDRETIHDQWVVKYGDEGESRLCLQIGERGMAAVRGKS